MLQGSLLDTSADRWVSVSDAARLENANKSSISRFIERNPDVPVRRDAQGKVKSVDYPALRAARAGSLAVQDSQLMVSPTPVAHAGPATSRKRELEERKLELDLAEREGDLLDRTAVTMALEAIAVTLAQSLERRRRKLATDTVQLGDVRQGELAIKAADRELMNTIVSKLKALSADMVSDADDQVEPLAA